MVKLLTRCSVLAYSTRADRKISNGFDSSKGSRRTAPQSLRFFCARVMAGCAWGAYSPAGFLDTGLSTRAQLATIRLTAVMASSKSKFEELHHE